MSTPPPTPDGSFSRFPWWRRWFGNRSETAAAKYLRKLGYRVLARNHHDQLGEIDLLVLDGETLVIVEVRSTASDDLQYVAASVNFEKQRRLTDATLRYLQKRKLLDRIAVRFDVLAMSWPADQTEPTILHLRHAFESVGRFQFHS